MVRVVPAHGPFGLASLLSPLSIEKVVHHRDDDGHALHQYKSRWPRANSVIFRLTSAANVCQHATRSARAEISAGRMQTGGRGGAANTLSAATVPGLRFYARSREGPMQLILQECQPPSNIRPRRQPRGEPARQVRHAVRSAHTEDLGELRVRDRRMPPCQVRQRRTRLMATPTSTNLRRLNLIAATDDLADPPQVDTLQLAGLAPPFPWRVLAHQFPQPCREIQAPQRPAMVSLGPGRSRGLGQPGSHVPSVGTRRVRPAELAAPGRQ